MKTQSLAESLPTDLIDLSQAGAMLGNTSPETIRNWIAGGKLKGFRCGWKWKVSKAAVLAIVQTPLRRSGGTDAAHALETSRGHQNAMAALKDMGVG